MAFPDILSRNNPIEEYQKHQLQHKRIPRDIGFFDKSGTPVSCQIQHEDIPNVTCNDFNPINYNRGKEEKILRLPNDSEDFTVNSVLKKFQLSVFNRLLTVSDWGNLSTDSDENVDQKPNQTYPSTNPIPNIVRSTPLDCPQMTQQTRRATRMTHNTSVQTLKMAMLNVVCDNSLQADKPQLCQAKQAHKLVLGKTDAPLNKKFPTTSDAPHLDTKLSIQ